MLVQSKSNTAGKKTAYQTLLDTYNEATKKTSNSSPSALQNILAGMNTASTQNKVAAVKAKTNTVSSAERPSPSTTSQVIPNASVLGNTLGNSVSQNNVPAAAKSSGMAANLVSSSGGGSTSGLSAPAYKASDNVIKAMTKTQELLDQLINSKTSYSDKIASLMNQISSREQFQYDPNNDVLFQNALSSAMRSGQTAMSNTMGQAADLTGGYGSSYATSVAAQQYNNFIQDAYNNLPEYYNMAYQKYANEGEALYDQLSAYNALDAKEYEQKLNAFNAQNSNWQTLYSQEYGEWQDKINNALNIANYNLNEKQVNANIAKQNYDIEASKRAEAFERQQLALQQKQATSDTQNKDYSTKLDKFEKNADTISAEFWNKMNATQDEAEAINYLDTVLKKYGLSGWDDDYVMEYVLSQNPNNRQPNKVDSWLNGSWKSLFTR